MIHDIQKLLNEYQAWLHDKTSLRQVDECVEITTPYLDRHNDYVQIYAQKQNGGYLLTDDGYTVSDLELSGCKLESPKRQQLLRTVLNGFGVKLQDNDALVVRATHDDFAIRKHNLLQAILAVNDMFYLAEPVITSLFLEDVTQWLDLIGVRYTPRAKFTGKSGFDHLFNFVVPKPERIIQTINRPSRDAVQIAVFAWTDIQEVRAADAHMYTILNDSEQPVPSGIVEALRSYGVTPVPWTAREQVAEALSA